MDQSKNVSEAGKNDNTSSAKNIVETAIGAGNFGTFAAAIKTAGLTEELATKGPFTVFVPSDEAFKKLPSGALETLLKDSTKLKAVLNYHVVSGRQMASDVKSGEVMTLQGSTLTAAVSGTDVRVNGARVTKTNVVATNGVIHMIDTVILPKSWQLQAMAA